MTEPGSRAAPPARPSVAFLNPSVGFSDRRKAKPIGLAYIMAFLESKGYPSSGFDFGDSEADAIELASKYHLDSFDVVGMSVYNESFRNAVATATWIKRRRPDCLIVLGGPHATAVHEHIAVTYDCFDVVVRREGEEAMLELLTHLDDPEELRSTPGTTWRGTDPAAPVVNADRAFVPDLDVLPFPDAHFVSDSGYPDLTYYDEIQQRLKPALTICSSRSCPYNCSFCGVLTIGRKYRSRDAQRVVDELAHFRVSHGVHYEHIYFSDANFFVYPSRALEIAEALHELDPEVSFSFGTRVNQILKAAEILPELKRLGLRFIELGIESASPEVLQRLAKGVSPDVNVAAVKLLRRLDIEISIDFIMLDPASTLEDIALNLTFLREQGFYDYLPHDHLYSALVLYEGTPIRKFYAERFGMDFDPAELPNPFTLFENSAVQRFSDELRAFRDRWQAHIEQALAQGELASAALATNPGATSRQTRAQLQLDLITLRHAPNLFAENLLADAREGYLLADAGGSDSLLPMLGPDRVHLTEVIDRTKSVAAGVGFDDRLVQAASHGRKL